jgi:DNA invertase Pin-like site-specific DNA recombinase
MNMIGYARVSTGDQNTAAQVEKLQAAGCTAIYKENASGGRWDRPELHKLMDRIGNGDVLVVWKLDRLSRSLSDLLHILKKLDDAGAGFRSLTEAIDTTTPAGRMMMQMLGSFAEFERAMLRERTKLGLARARAAGRKGGARFKLTPAQQKEAFAMVEAGRTQTEVAELFRVDRSTISRLVSERRVLDRKALKPMKTERSSPPNAARKVSSSSKGNLDDFPSNTITMATQSRSL